jgi:glycosyltransferase involved in cell wall biosynthesis
MPIPTVTVVLPVYNGAELLGRAIESVLEQDFRDLELLVVDNDSTDQSVAVADGYGVRVIREPKRGAAAARNAGIRESNADSPYIALLDHDDRWLPGKLTAQVEALESTPDVGLCHTRTRYVYTSQERAARLSEVVLDAEAAAVDHVLPRNLVAASSVVLRRSVLRQSGLFFEAIGRAEDWDLWIQMAPHCRFLALDTVLCEYIVHGKNKSLDMPSVVRSEITILGDRLPKVLAGILATLPAQRHGHFIRSVRRRLAGDYSDVGKDLARKGRLLEAIHWHMRAIRLSPTTGKLYLRMLRAGAERLMAGSS